MPQTLKRIRLDREQRGLEGFTLIELLLVIIVLGILAAIVVFALGAVTSSSASAACTTDAKSVATAITAEQTADPGDLPVLGDTGAPGDLVPNYLATLPANSNLYTISLSQDSLAVNVALNSNDPGEASTISDAPNGGVLFNADGNNAAFQFGSGDGTLAGQGICAGA
jgi:general secretion pathway protein G